MFALMILSFTVVPVVEEVFFRGFLYNALCRSFPKIAAVLLQAFFFAVIHPHGLLGLLVLGVVLASVYRWRKTLLTPVLIHGFYNFALAAYFSATLILMVYTPVFGIKGYDHTGKIVVAEVRPHSSAYLAGIQPRDVVVSFGGVPVDDLDVLEVQVRSKKVGRRVPVVILRGGEQLTIEVVMYNRFHEEKTE